MEKIGGQAVIEGVMMRSNKRLVIAVRKPNKKIVVKEEKLNLISEKLKKWFFIRGMVNLVEILVHGIKSLNYSAEQATGVNKKKKSEWSVYLMILTLIISLAIGLLFFKFLPLLIAQLINPKSNIIFNLIDGVVKLFIFVAYVYFISLMKDVKEIFKYHGAEHKVINCFEAKKKLTVQNAKKFSTLNPRCGTSFVIIVILVSIVTYIFIPKTFSFTMKLIYRILLLPVIAGISYELLKLSGKYEKNWFFKIFIKPGLWIQKLTTKEPNNKQLGVALVALKRVL